MAMERRPGYDMNFPDELAGAMRRAEKLGVNYPEGYYEDMARKYSTDNVPYPYIVRHIGIPRIMKHFFYGNAHKIRGNFLDYGCGTGDAIRQLIRDGYPSEKVHGFDVNDGSISLGADIYLDEEFIRKLTTVAPEFPETSEVYDLVYSGSVVHVIRDEDEFRQYLNNACNALKKDGIFFGSTLGLEEFADKRNGQGPPRLMRSSELYDAFSKAGFSGIRIITEEMPDMRRRSAGNMCLYQFYARK
ncbi:class I SAM-dependent methyltransferase [Methanoplanus limicola]|uniref:Methyltransferase type 12 n=1 Tax=Methanoplanus limicola DSM 2279 TaxID=937775 RepID=H1Z242_9EURY|nr:class I SAM-dependent methyltransferase [Methanoplanus limicola]EHQ36387.1 Methyltransferase type 12 [Methanoplanus limicola DSM 2279]